MSRLIRNTAIAGAGAAAAWGAWELWRKAEVNALQRRLPGGTKVMILGSGFGGMNAASELARLMPHPDNGEIRLVDQRGSLLFTPMLTEVAGGEVDDRHVVAVPGRISRRVKFAKAEIQEIDIRNKRVTVALAGEEIGIPHSTETWSADHVVICLGSVANFHGVPGLKENALTIKTVQEARAIRNRALELLQRAATERNEESIREMLTFVVGGGGYTGVETTAALNDLVREGAREASIPHNCVRIILAEPGERLMSETTPELAQYAQRKLEERGVEVMLRTKVTSAGSEYVELDGGRRIAARTIIWAGGVKPNPLVEKLECRKGKHGGIVVDETCAVPDHPGVWAIGDCAEIPNGYDGSYAPTAQNATREGTHVARNIVKVLTGQHPEPFRYQPLGELALTGRHTGVARIYGVEFSGPPAWFLWRAVYLLKMPQVSQRVRIGLDWLLDLAFGRNLADVS